jgi:hypothetical protein
MFLITLAVLFLLVLFLAKKTTVFEKTALLAQEIQSGLIYDDTTIEQLVEMDTDGDTVPDWQEKLYGLDPTQKETVSGIPDSTAINKLRVEQGLVSATGDQDMGELTETEKFARELFSTAASISQNGNFDQSLTEQVGASLADKIKNNPQDKVFTLSDLKITENISPETYTNYSTEVMNIWRQNTSQAYTVTEILERFVNDQKNVDVDALKDLDPIITSANKVIESMAKMSVPRAFAYQHLDYLNGMERIVENLSDLRLYESDPLVALGGMNQYEKNLELYVQAVQNLTDTVNQKITKI